MNSKDNLDKIEIKATRAKKSLEQRIARKDKINEYIKTNKFSEILQIGFVKKKVSKKDFAEKLEMSHSNVSTKLLRNNWTEGDMRQAAEALGYRLEIRLVDDDTDDIIQ